MAKRKLQKFAEVDTFKNCFFLSFDNFKKQGLLLRGKWHTDFFNNSNPIVLELGCGKGEYTVGLAERYPNKNFIGVDIKGNRIHTGAKQAIEKKMNNVAFVRTRIDFIEGCFDQNEISEIWITFPDPQPQKTRERKRLTNKMFLDRYKKFLSPEGTINLKTDSESFFDYTLQVIEKNNFQLLDATKSLYTDAIPRDESLTSIKTHYENIFTQKGFSICFLKFRIK